MQQEPAQSHKDLTVWQRAMMLCTETYRLTENFPARETYGLSSQMRRAVVSIASNIAEGRNRGSRKDFGHFLRMAYGSVSELETQLDLSKRLGFIRRTDAQTADALIVEVSKMLRVMIKKLEARS